MKQSLLLTAFFAILIFSSCQKSLFVQEQQDSQGTVRINPDHPMKDSLQVIIDKYVAKGLPGVQVAVKNADGLFITSSGFAKIESGNKFQLTTPSWLFSITKMYTAALLMKMKERNGINLDNKNNRIS
ncbi:MAG: serine hydrolase [Bacteroidota bacterium]